MKRESIRRFPCPLCGGVHWAPHRFGLLRCADCELVVDEGISLPGEDVARNQEAFGEAYDPDSSFWVRWFNKWKNRRYLANLARAGSTGGELLEVGVGNGSFLQAARETGFAVSGCDLSESLCRRVGRATSIPIHCGSLDELPRAHWDIVAMHHVLEHVRDPVAFLRAARERLKPGGVLHVAVPNVACLEARLPGWSCYEPYHLTYFTADTLCRATRAAGLEVDRVGSHESFSSWLLASLRSLSQRKTNDNSSTGGRSRRVSQRPPLMEHTYRIALVGAGVVTWPIRAIQGWLGYGDELLLTARRPHE